MNKQASPNINSSSKIMSRDTQFAELIVRRKGSLRSLIDEMTPANYDGLRSAVELGKWPAGKKLDSEQLEICMQAVILYEAKNVRLQDRTGFDLPTGCSSSMSRTSQVDSEERQAGKK